MTHARPLYTYEDYRVVMDRIGRQLDGLNRSQFDAWGMFQDRFFAFINNQTGLIGAAPRHPALDEMMYWLAMERHLDAGAVITVQILKREAENIENVPSSEQIRYFNKSIEEYVRKNRV